METEERRRGRMITASVKLPLISILCLLLNQALALALAVQKNPCQDTCGNVPIYFPFGIGEGCFMNKNFEVSCNYSFSPARPFLTRINMELLNVYSVYPRIQVNNSVIFSNCSHKTQNSKHVSLLDSPFVFSNVSNRFAAIGCGNYALLLDSGNNRDIVSGCLSFCRNNLTPTNLSSGCRGINCCQTTIPPNIQSFEAIMYDLSDGQACKLAFMVGRDWLENESSSLKSLDALKQRDHVPATLEWATFQGYCDITNVSNIRYTRDRTYSWEQFNRSLVCICKCKDSNSCTNPRGSYCHLYCMNKPGGYSCSCPLGHDQEDSVSKYCYPRRVSWEKSRARTKGIIIGCGSGFGFLLLLIGLLALCKFIKRRRALKLKEKFFKRNGGFLLEQKVSSNENHVEPTKVFTSKELEIATDNFHVNRILGHGGQGTVYKGMLTDGRVVAIKKSKVVDENKVAEFINEVVLLSQINHRNVVKIYGCCLETEVPLLVYEFIPNGTLFYYIHNNQYEEMPFPWKMRLQIATEVASALSYLHSAASMPIYHRDIKSSNILLDEKYRAKVADFGTSKSTSIDQTHVTTRVQGTFGYLDPEYLQSSQFTDKSDVYSFGVVLVELLTGQKPLTREKISLATYFLLSMDEDRLFEIVDDQILKEGGKEEIVGVAKLAKRCLNLKGKKRPSMKSVAMELEVISSSQGVCSTPEQELEEVDYAVGYDTGPWEVASSSTRSMKSSVRSRLDVQPLLSNDTF